MNTDPTIPADPRQCQSCFGEGEHPTDAGPVACPDCGGAGILPSPDVLVEWRIRAIERGKNASQGEGARDLQWLAFELRRARAALTQILSLTEELEDTEPRRRARFLANEALGLYALEQPQAPRN